MFEHRCDERPEAVNVGAVADEDLTPHLLVEAAIGRSRRGRDRRHHAEHDDQREGVDSRPVHDPLLTFSTASMTRRMLPPRIFVMSCSE